MKERPWQETKYVREELVGGGLIRSLGGWAELRGLRLKGRSRVKWDERILGTPNFVMEVLAEANETVDGGYKLKSLGYDVEAVAQTVSEIYGIDPKGLFLEVARRFGWRPEVSSVTGLSMSWGHP